MGIENRNLEPGTRLVATYKKQRHVCTVEEGEGGKKAYVLEGGRRFTSPSAAGSAVMGGVACNGWRFWMAEGTEPSKPGATAKGEENGKLSAAKPLLRHPRYKIIRRVPNQQGLAEGQVRWFCDACMKSFTAESGSEPAVCPEGHAVDDPQLAGVAE